MSNKNASANAARNSAGNAPVVKKKRSIFKRFWRWIFNLDLDSERRDTGSANKRQLFAVVMLTGLAMMVGSFLFYYSALDSDAWKARANSQQITTKVLQAKRGSIYDANGTVLAQSSSTWNVVYSPLAIIENDSDKEEFIGNYLAANFGYDISDYNRIMAKAHGNHDDEDDKTVVSQYVSVVKDISRVEMMQLEADLKNAEISKASVYTEEEFKRYYPNDSLAANIIGFVGYKGNDTTKSGVYGLEAYYEDYLRGTDGKVTYMRTVKTTDIENTSDMYYSAIDGNSLVLTIDEVMQHYLEKNLEQCVSSNQVINRACGIIMNCKTGAIIAMATAPGYSLNEPSTLNAYDKARIEELIASGAEEEEIDKITAKYREQQWKNKAITELYYPGSVFKTVTCASALEEEVVNMNSTFSCAGVATVAGTRIKCWSTAGHGTLNLQQAVTKSCNPSFIAIGQLLGADKFCNYFEAFGFTEPTGIDLPGEASSLYVPRDRMGIVELASSSFGQTNKVTPIQMATAFAAVVNGGYLLTPYVVDKIIDADGNVVKTTQPQIRRQVISEETSAQMREILETVVTTNGGSNAYINGYRIGGKSGTTEKIDEYNERLATTGEDHMTYVSSFAACVPANDPEIVMLVMADTPTGNQYYGSAVAAPVVSAVFKEGLEHLGIYPTYTAEELSKMDVTVPYVLGSAAMNAEAKLNEYGLEARFVGDPSGTATVSTQIPGSGVTAPKGSTVVLYLGTEHDIERGTVPDVTGMTVSQANKAITDAGFNIKISGGAAENDNALAVSQSILGGVEAYKGNVIEVTFLVNDETG